MHTKSLRTNNITLREQPSNVECLLRCLLMLQPMTNPKMKTTIKILPGLLKQRENRKEQPNSLVEQRWLESIVDKKVSPLDRTRCYKRNTIIRGQSNKSSKMQLLKERPSQNRMKEKGDPIKGGGGNTSHPCYIAQKILPRTLSSNCNTMVGVTSWGMNDQDPFPWPQNFQWRRGENKTLSVSIMP